MLATAVKNALKRAKGKGNTSYRQGPALIECFGADVGAAIQHEAATRVMQSYARKFILPRLARRRQQINIKVLTQDDNEIFFKILPTTQLGRLMQAFCNRQGVAINSVRFLFDGDRIRHNQTPQELDMEDGDVIDVMVEQVGD